MGGQGQHSDRADGNKILIITIQAAKNGGQELKNGHVEKDVKSNNRRPRAAQ